MSQHSEFYKLLLVPTKIEDNIVKSSVSPKLAHLDLCTLQYAQNGSVLLSP